MSGRNPPLYCTFTLIAACRDTRKTLKPNQRQYNTPSHVVVVIYITKAISTKPLHGQKTCSELNILNCQFFILPFEKKQKYMCLKKNQNTPRPSEHPPVMGGEKMSKCLGGIKRLQIQNLFMAFEQVPRCR